MVGFSLGRALADALAFVPKAWISCWLSLSLLLGLGFLAVRVDFTDYGVAMWVIAFVSVVLMALGGLYRAALFGAKAAQSGLGFGGIQMGGAEWRLISGGFFSVLFLSFIGLFASMLVILVASGTELSTHYNNSFKTVLAAFFEPFTTEKIVIMAIACLVGMMLLSLLIGLLPYQVASVALNRTVSINALRFSQGKLLKMIIGLAVLSSPMILAAAIQIYAHSFTSIDGLFHSLLVLETGIILPLIIGFFASIYRQSPLSGMTGREI
jgi:hypothetical protein